MLSTVHVFLLFSYVERASFAGLAGASRNVRTALRNDIRDCGYVSVLSVNLKVIFLTLPILL